MQRRNHNHRDKRRHVTQTYYTGFVHVSCDCISVSLCIRLVDMQHVLVQQLEKRAEVLAVVKERILTANSCSITQMKKEQCIFQGVLKLVGLLGGSVKVGVAEIECVLQVFIIQYIFIFYIHLTNH